MKNTIFIDKEIFSFLLYRWNFSKLILIFSKCSMIHRSLVCRQKFEIQCALPHPRKKQNEEWLVLIGLRANMSKNCSIMSYLNRNWDLPITFQFFTMPISIKCIIQIILCFFNRLWTTLKLFSMQTYSIIFIKSSYVVIFKL